VKVKIKTWKEMEREFGLNGWGDINCMCNFTKEMENKMPEDRIIVLVNSAWKQWDISTDMISEQL